MYKFPALSNEYVTLWHKNVFAVFPFFIFSTILHYSVHQTKAEPAHNQMFRGPLNEKNETKYKSQTILSLKLYLVPSQ